MLRNFISIFVVTVLSGCFPSSPQYLARPETISIAGTYVHQPSGFTLPVAAGEFVRASIYKYDAEGKNIGVAYNLTNASKPIAATVYIYPSPSITSIGSPASVIETAQTHLCNQEFGAQQQEIIAAHPNAKKVNSGVATSGSSVSGIHNLSAHFEYEEIFASIRQPLFSELELSCYINDKWNVKYRVTYPKSLAVEHEIQQLKQAIQITMYGS